MSGDYETYEWHETPMENSVSRRNALERGLAYGKDGTPLITGLTREAVTQGTPFHLEGVATNWANCRTSDPYDGTVGGKL